MRSLCETNYIARARGCNVLPIVRKYAARVDKKRERGQFNILSAEHKGYPWNMGNWCLVIGRRIVMLNIDIYRGVCLFIYGSRNWMNNVCELDDPTVYYRVGSVNQIIVNINRNEFLVYSSWYFFNHVQWESFSVISDIFLRKIDCINFETWSIRKFKKVPSVLTTYKICPHLFYLDTVNAGSALKCSMH